MKIIGMTGPTGSGKSTVAELAKKLGFFVIDADNVSRQVTISEILLIKQLRISFGNGIIKGDGSLDRKALARAAFKTEERKNELQRIIFPYIKNQIAKDMEKAKSEGYKYCLLDAPTLFESGLDSVCNVTVAVLCDRDERKRRILLRDGLTEEDAEIRLGAGKTDEYYKERADKIIYNNGNIAEFCENAKIFLTEEQGYE